MIEAILGNHKSLGKFLVPDDKTKQNSQKLEYIGRLVKQLKFDHLHSGVDSDW